MSPKQLLIATLVVLMLGGCETQGERIDWRDNDSYSGWVTDAATGEPIEGAVVVGVWKILRRHHNFIVEGNPDEEIIRLAETITDTDGYFAFKPLGYYNPPLGWQRDEGRFPSIAFFKPGYEPTYRQRFTWEFGDQRLEPNPRGVPLRREAWKREIQLYRYMTGPLTGPRPHDPIWRNMADEQKILNFLTNLAFSLARNVDISASDFNPLYAAQRRKAVEAQWRSIVMVDAEIRKYRPQYMWSTREIREALAAIRPSQKAPPKTNVQRMKPSRPAVGLPEGESTQ